MHACGHDTHMAILMATAEILSKNRDFPGTVKFIFQPSEEGPPKGEEGGARLMIKEGVLNNPDVDAIFGLHISSLLPMNKVYYKPRGFFASSSRLTIKIKGKQTHGGTPWFGVDPIVISAEIISALQTIISRQSNLTEEAAVLSIGQINGGNRFNIIPEEVTMIGTIRALSYEMRDNIKQKIHNLVDGISKSFGAESEVEIMVYDMQGRVVETLLNGNVDSGYHSITWNADNHSSGLYFVRMFVGNNQYIQKIMLVK